MSTLTQAQQDAIRDKLAGMVLPAGIGDEHNACSIAAINLALTGELTDTIPECMSPVIGRWVIGVQDAMPNDMRNSREWRELLPLAAGTGRKHEAVRTAVVIGWLWATVLPQVQPVADARGFGTEWRAMLREKTPDAAAAYAADAAARAAVAATDAYWANVNPCALLRKLIEVGE